MDLIPPRKTRIPKLINAWSGTGLTRVADEAVLVASRVITEGFVEEPEPGSFLYCGTTMLTVNLAELEGRLAVDGYAPDDLLEHLSRSVFFRLRLMRLAREEAEQRCHPRLMGCIETELEFKIETDSLLIDIDTVGSVKNPVDGSGKATGNKR